MKKTAYRLLAFALIAVLFMQLAPAAEAAGKITHGTSQTEITPDMVNNIPPKDYHINASTQAAAREGVYNAFFLKEELQEVHIQIEENNLNYLLQNAVDEPYVMTTSVTIGNTKIGYCGLRTKGNFTLYHSYHDNPGSDRFSFTVNFGKYINKETYGEKQTFYGCDKISFNNFFFDKSMMKEYMALKLMEEMGLPTPQYGLAKLYINDAYYGVYFMVEAMDSTVLEQHWNVKGSELSDYLVKPVGTNFDYNVLKDDPSALYEGDEETLAKVESMLPTALEWSRRLTNLSNGKDFDGKSINVNSEEYVQLLSSVLDLEEVIKYFAVASWLCQMDNMFTNYQNFGLYLSAEGVATLVPWDYDLAFGCYYPSSAENTANYPMDVMYRLEIWDWENEADVSKRTYRNFPLFQVIYQNKSLMSKYHGYLLECSQIAALGGTVSSTGVSYDPGYFNSCMEAVQDELLAAASEKTASNVYYMNGIRQPADVEAALPNLSKIIAMRAVGVYAQILKMDASVSAGGCNLETLGNAIVGEYQNSGELISIDAATGIFVQADYRGGRWAPVPVLILTENAEAASMAAHLLEAGENDAVIAYDLQIKATANPGYTVTIPLSADWAEKNCQFYLLQDGKLTELEVTANGHLRTFRINSLGIVVLRCEGGGAAAKDDPGDYWIIGGICAVCVLIIGAAVASELIRRSKKKKANS